MKDFSKVGPAAQLWPYQQGAQPRYQPSLRASRQRSRTTNLTTSSHSVCTWSVNFCLWRRIQLIQSCLSNYHRASLCYIHLSNHLVTMWLVFVFVFVYFFVFAIVVLSLSLPGCVGSGLIHLSFLHQLPCDLSLSLCFCFILSVSFPGCAVLNLVHLSNRLDVMWLSRLEAGWFGASSSFSHQPDLSQSVLM